MKYSLILGWLLCTVTYSQSLFSNKIGFDSSITLKKGIYASFQEFKINNPSNTTPFGTREFGKLNSLFSNTFTVCKLVVENIYKGNFSKETPAWGFCDGKKVYVARFKMIYSKGRLEGQTLPVNPRKATYYPIAFLGRYCIFIAEIKVRITALSGQNGATMSGSQTQGVLFILDVNDGHIEQLTEDSVGQILEKDPAMLKAFKAEKRKDKKLEDYIKAYSLKHPEEIKQ